MDIEENGEDTGKKELEKIMNCLKKNDYVFDGLEDADTRGSMVAYFKKDIN